MTLDIRPIVAPSQCRVICRRRILARVTTRGVTVLGRTVVIVLLALVPSIAVAQPRPDRTSPLEVAAALTICLGLDRDRPYELAGDPEKARLYEDERLVAIVARAQPSAADLVVLNDPVQPPLVVSFSDSTTHSDDTDEADRRRFRRGTSRCLSEVYPPR